jgi:hypothetical protein
MYIKFTMGTDNSEGIYPIGYNLSWDKFTILEVEPTDNDTYQNSGGKIVSDVDDANLRSDPGDHAVDDPDELVGPPEIGEK